MGLETVREPSVGNISSTTESPCIGQHCFMVHVAPVQEGQLVEGIVLACIWLLAVFVVLYSMRSKVLRYKLILNGLWNCNDCWIILQSGTSSDRFQHHETNTKNRLGFDLALPCMCVLTGVCIPGLRCASLLSLHDKRVLVSNLHASLYHKITTSDSLPDGARCLCHCHDVSSVGHKHQNNYTLGIHAQHIWHRDQA